ncbi:MAG: hypothetical protein JNK87_29025 [Bryobacterales bacterium]|nr:hypothetical protein [Bryobacterales bacterium]
MRAQVQGSVVFVCAETGERPVARGARVWFRRFVESSGGMLAGAPASGFQRSSSCDKAVARKVLAKAGLAIAKGIYRDTAGEIDLKRIGSRLGYPVVVKQARESGVGVGVHLAENEQRACEVVRWHQEQRRKGILFEQFVAGREFTVWILEQQGVPRIGGIIEFSKPGWNPLMDQGAKMRCRKVKRFTKGDRFWPEALVEPPMSGGERKAVERAALAAHRVCGLRHYSRVDLILTPAGPVILDVNANPELGGWLALCAQARGSTMRAVLRGLLEEVVWSYGRT